METENPRLTPDQQAEVDSLRDIGASTRRATVPAMEDLLYLPIPVLDHGFIRVVDYMGDDAAVVQAARVSYGRGTKQRRDDAGLINYLMRNRHTSPFEMCEIKLHVKLPIFVARQWIRHRTACLAGDSRLYFDLPSALRKGRRARYTMTVERFHRLWHEGTVLSSCKRKPTYTERIDPDREYTVPELARLVERREEDLRNLVRAGKVQGVKRPCSDPREPQIFIRGIAWSSWAGTRYERRIAARPRLSKMLLRMCDEETGEIRSTHVTDIWRTGRRPVFRVTLDNGYMLTMTKDHRCLTESGWMTLEQATGLRLRVDGGITWRGDAPRLAVNGMRPHRDAAWLQQRREEGLSVSAMADLAGVSYHTIRKALKDHRLTFTAPERARLSGLSQRGQRRTFYGRPWSAARLEVVRRARSGAASNWKGGITAERASIGAWTTSHAQAIHRANDYRCVLCGGSEALNAHHIDPVWHDPSKSRDLTKLTSLCRPCHARVHHNNLELALLAAVRSGADLRAFWLMAPQRFPRHESKRLPRVNRLIRTYARVVRIDYLGEQETFDLAVSGPFNNFVANGLIVHNSVNEYSARYSILDREFYIPTPEHLASQASANRQGRGDVLPPDQARQVLALLQDDAARLYEHYERLLGETAQGAVVPEGIGLARELARMDLTLNFYTQWYWKTDLHNLLHFLMLRADPHAQYEIRAYADALLDVVERWTPLTHAAFVDYRLRAVELSAKGVAVVRRLLAGEPVERGSSGMSAGEWRELMQALGRSEQAR